MTNNDLRRFTHKELRAFTNNELREPPESLVQAIERYGSDIPYNAYTKLCDMCEDVNTALVNAGQAPLQKPSISVKDVLDYLYKLFYLIRSIPEMQKIISQLFDLFP